MSRSSRPTSTRSLLALLAGGAFVALGCGGSDDHDAPPPPAPTPAAQETAAPPAASEEPAGLAPLSSRSRAEGDRIFAAGASFALPADWTREQPSSSMRLAQASLPGPAGPASMTLFHFGAGGGGGVEANLSRWLGQVELDAGTTPVRDAFDVGDYRVHWLEAEGTLLPSTMGAGPDAPQPGSRLLGAVVEGSGGPWFFKITGPSETVAAQRTAFIDMLKTVEPA